METELTAALHVGRDLLRLRKLVRKLGFGVARPMRMFMGN